MAQPFSTAFKVRRESQSQQSEKLWGITVFPSQPMLCPLKALAPWLIDSNGKASGAHCQFHLFYHDSILPQITQLLTGKDCMLLVLIKWACRSRGKEGWMQKNSFSVCEGLCVYKYHWFRKHFHEAFQVRQASKEVNEFAAWHPTAETYSILPCIGKLHIQHTLLTPQTASRPIYLSCWAHYEFLCQGNVFGVMGKNDFDCKKIINRQINLHKRFQILVSNCLLSI